MDEKTIDLSRGKSQERLNELEKRKQLERMHGMVANFMISIAIERRIFK